MQHTSKTNRIFFGNNEKERHDSGRRTTLCSRENQLFDAFPHFAQNNSEPIITQLPNTFEKSIVQKDKPDNTIRNFHSRPGKNINVCSRNNQNASSNNNLKENLNRPNKRRNQHLVPEMDKFAKKKLKQQQNKTDLVEK